MNRYASRFSPKGGGEGAKATGRMLGFGLVLTIAMFLGVFAPALCAAADEDANDPGNEIRLRLNQAKKLGAKGQLPIAFWDVDSRLKDAEKNGATDRQWNALRTDVLQLLNRAEFVEEMRKQKSAVEAILGRFDQSLAEIADLHGVDLDPMLTGSAAADALIDELDRRQLQRQVQIDSLTVSNRRLREMAEGQSSATDSLLTALQVEVSSLRKQLWETELRVGVAEADRSAAETVLTAKQQREEAITALRSTFDPEEAEILLTPAGGAVLRLFGIDFAVGSAEIQVGQAALLTKVTDVIRVFPDAGLTVEGHTDNTGSRQANLRLSRRRAETVAKILEGNLSLMDGAITTDGFGPDRPLALNDTAEGRARNRRIDVIIEMQE